MKINGLSVVLFRVVCCLAILLCGGQGGSWGAAVTVDAANVVDTVGIGQSGVCAGTKFWTTLSPNYRSEMVTARIGMVRIAAYPSQSGTGTTLEDLDRKVAQLLNAGAEPLFIQCIASPTNTTFSAALYDLNGNLGTGGTIATNMAFLVNRYKNPPFNLAVQYWEVGNEPDITVSYRVSSSQEYINFFQAIHNRLVASGLRGNVKLCGPVVSWDYGFGVNNGFTDTIMNDFLDACANQVDVVTRHVYGRIYDWENIAITADNHLNSPVEMVHFDQTITGRTRGERALLNRMDLAGVPSTVTTGITEMNLFNDGITVFNHTIVQGLWFRLADHFSLYNPRSEMMTGFQFDRYNDLLAFYTATKSRAFPYWAAYIHGKLTGDQILAQTSNDSHLVVTGSKDDYNVYVEVINRYSAAVSSSVAIANANVSAPTIYQLTATVTPDVGTASTLGTNFTYTFPAQTSTIFRFPRNDAPAPPTPAPAPTEVLLDTDFTAAPAGMATYTVAGAFIPVVTGGDLMISTSSNVLVSQGAVVFAGQPLTAAKTRVQARIGFRVDGPYKEGFVFAAYSANPGKVGNAGPAMGHYNQGNHIWGVKVDNDPDEVAVLTTPNATVDGLATQQIASYSAQELFLVVDYEGAAGTVRARLYSGTDDTGTVIADVTNRIGNPASLPTGTVFGFTASTSNFRQITRIHGVKILTDGFVLGQERILDNDDASGITITGTWSRYKYTGTYGASYHYAKYSSTETRTVTYTPTLQGSGYRDVYVWWSAYTNRDVNVPITVHYLGGTATVYVNQRLNGGQWNKIGTWPFAAGTSGNVVVETAGTTNYVIADAVKFTNVTAP